MLEVSEVGNKISKADYKKAVPDLRVGLINAVIIVTQTPRVIIWIAEMTGSQPI